MPSSNLILCHPLLLSIFPSIRWPKYWSFSFSISPANEYSGLISFRMDWLHLLAVQETLRSLLQHHSSKASILHHSAFFIVQLSHPYMTTRKTIALIRWTFVDKVQGGCIWSWEVRKDKLVILVGPWCYGISILRTRDMSACSLSMWAQRTGCAKTSCCLQTRKRAPTQKCTSTPTLSTLFWDIQPVQFWEIISVV